MSPRENPEVFERVRHDALFKGIVTAIVTASCALLLGDIALDVLVARDLYRSSKTYFAIAVLILGVTYGVGALFGALLRLLHLEARDGPVGRPERHVACDSLLIACSGLPVWWWPYCTARAVFGVWGSGVPESLLADDGLGDLGLWLGAVRVLEAGAEATPQLLLQTYAAAHDVYVRGTSSTLVIRLSIAGSLVSISLGVTRAFLRKEPALLQACGWCYFMSMLATRLAVLVAAILAFGGWGLVFPSAFFAIRLYLATTAVSLRKEAIYALVTQNLDQAARGRVFAAVVVPSDAIFSSLVSILLPIFPYMGFPVPLWIKWDFHPMGSQAWAVFVLNVLENVLVHSTVMIARSDMSFFRGALFPTVLAAVLLRVFTRTFAKSKGRSWPLVAAVPLVRRALVDRRQKVERTCALVGYQDLSDLVDAAIAEWEDEDLEEEADCCCKEKTAAAEILCLVAPFLVEEGYYSNQFNDGARLLDCLVSRLLPKRPHHTAEALANLALAALDDDLLDDLGERALGPLVACLEDRGERHAATAIAALVCGSSANQTLAIREGLVPRVADALAVDDALLRVPLLQALAAPKIATISDVAVVQKTRGAIPDLVDMLDRGEEICEALPVLAALATNDSVHRQAVLDAGLVERLVTLLSHANLDVRRAATTTLASVAAGSSRVQHEACRWLAIPPLVDLAFAGSAADDDLLRREAANALKTLALDNPDVAAKIRDYLSHLRLDRSSTHLSLRRAVGFPSSNNNNNGAPIRVTSSSSSSSLGTLLPPPPTTTLDATY
ncbi:hypothetical protein CTAYLR_000105 [Chrysophaeum taylorii]|uniref:Uncharacterized protein n=1 Tax=Chrysophaeum taylorii TaxID=2483200 RepID=A0AAD7XK48_9STRA|nr:hypothetical protein CTAYLR_000105 [Chrysophaeum taylorii]